MRARFAMPLLMALPLVATGCFAGLFAAGTVAGAGALVWQSGWLRGTLPEPIDRVHRASKSAMGNFKATVEKDTLGPRSAVLDTTLPDGRRAVVEVRALTEKETQVRIRVGFWGDQAFSIRIFEQMKKHL